MKTKEMKRPKIGQKTPRGGAVIFARSLIDPDGWAVVLAIKPDQEYVIWNESEAAEYQSGAYCLCFSDAIIEYNQRRQNHDKIAMVRKGGSVNDLRQEVR